jgi:flagellar hook-basal body complex protein FliE
MNPLDAISALSQMQAPAAAPGVPASPAMGPVSEYFSIPQNAQAAATVSPAAAEGPSTWGHMVQQMVLDVNQKQQTAAQKVSDVLQGGPTPVHEALAATEEANLSFEFLAEMRNKVVESYQQIMQMQV